MKISMAENHEFDIYCAYSLITKQHLNQSKLHEFLSANRINSSNKEINIMCQYLFLNNQDVTVNVFCDALLPSTNENLRSYHINKISNSEPPAHTQLFIKDSLIELFETILNAQRQLTTIRQNLINQHLQKDSHQLWRILNDKNPNMTGNITREAIFTFVQDNGASYTQSEWKALLRSIHSNSDHLTQSQFNQLVQAPRSIMVSNKFDSGAVQKKMDQFGIKAVSQRKSDKQSQNGYYGFRKVFDPVRDGRPNFDVDESTLFKNIQQLEYLSQLRDYRERYVAPSRNTNIHFRLNQKEISSHDHFFQDYYLHLHERDQQELLYNRFGRNYVYSQEKKL